MLYVTMLSDPVFRYVPIYLIVLPLHILLCYDLMLRRNTAKLLILKGCYMLRLHQGYELGFRRS